jgi:hypothetical protein
MTKKDIKAILQQQYNEYSRLDTMYHGFMQKDLEAEGYKNLKDARDKGYTVDSMVPYKAWIEAWTKVDTVVASAELLGIKLDKQ